MTKMTNLSLHSPLSILVEISLQCKKLSFKS